MIQTKHIFIARHGHADFDCVSDKLRNLTGQGQQAVESSATFIKNKCEDYKLDIDLCICSDAIRTIQTSEIICKQLAISKLKKHSELYSTVASKWMDHIIGSEVDNLVLVGHNPTLSQLVNQLTGSQCYMKPANCAFIKLQIKDNEIIFPTSLLGYFNNE
jgi:phosphohistidine phosphatase SixA